MVPFLSSTVPDFSNCTGPTRLGLLSEGDGPKYERPTDAPTEGGAGKRLQPGPGPIGPGPGPWSVLGFAANGESSGPNSEPRLTGSAFARLGTRCSAGWAVAMLASAIPIVKIKAPPRMR